MSSHGSIVAAMVMLTGAYLTATTLHAKPYRKASVNNGVATIGVTVFLAGCAAEVTTIYPHSQGASMCQSLFGVITALVGAWTLTTLTPLASMICKISMWPTEQMRAQQEVRP